MARDLEELLNDSLASTPGLHGSYWDPRVNGVIMALVAAGVTVIWGPRTLARHQNP
jgi:hypothetical protein